ncbi:MAG: CDP-alcohol phosphatidyltransferase family protein [Actinomycetota bacterium]|nr:CDP-alcohol phosphatidyltransferase family protein [Actinomycetota bacterium]
MVNETERAELKRRLKEAAKPACFGNWADNYGYPLTSLILPAAVKIGWLTPNVVTILSFIIYVIGSMFLFLNFSGRLQLAALLLVLGYIGDQLDGQIARARGLSSHIGNYLDKVVDVLKIYVITISLSISQYIRYDDVLWVFLGFTACFFFNFRYYIKLETVLSEAMRDEAYLKASALRQEELFKETLAERKELRASLGGQIKLFFKKNASIILVDEAEFAIFTAFFALINRLKIALILLAASQVLIAFFRLFQRGSQILRAKDGLLDPMRK